MNQNTLTHIVPALPPQIDGVGDYALNLARHLRQSHGIQGRFIVCDPSWDGPAQVENFPVKRLRMRNEAGLWNVLSSAKEQPAALLHYVGYGYHNRGVPLWLYQGIKSWLTEPGGGQSAGRKQFSTVFHELWASGKPWQSAFYLNPLQRWLAQGLHRLSDVSITSTHRMQEKLDEIQPRKTILLPIPSNVPAPMRFQRPARAGKGLRAVIFGQARTRASVVQSHSRLLRTLEAKGLLDCVVVIGKGVTTTSADIELLRGCVATERVKIRGELPAQQVSSAIAEADLFLSNYRAEWACKSGSLMAALAAGCPAVLCDGKNAEPLREDEHFVASDDSSSSVTRLAGLVKSNELVRIAGRAYEWYQGHADWRVIARRYQEVFAAAVRPMVTTQAMPFPGMISNPGLIPSTALSTGSTS